MQLFKKGQGKYAHLGLGPMRVRVNGKQTNTCRLFKVWQSMKERAAQAKRRAEARAAQ